MSKAFPEYWFQGSWSDTRVHSKGAEVACRIFQELKRYAEQEQVSVYILVQYSEDEFDRDIGIVDKAISCVDQNVLKLIDLRTSLADLRQHDINRYKRLFQGHMTSDGNYFVAETLWEAISQRTRMRGTLGLPTAKLPRN